MLIIFVAFLHYFQERRWLYDKPFHDFWRQLLYSQKLHPGGISPLLLQRRARSRSAGNQNANAGNLVERTGAVLVLNDSWSGSTIGYTGYEGDCSTSSSFIYRYRKLMEKGFFAENEMDTILVFGGTNDSWSNAPLGDETYADFREDDLFNVLPAICYFMTTLKQNHPNTRVVFIGNCDIKREILDCMAHAAQRLSVDFVELHDIDKINGHPTVLGMTQICDQVMEKLKD